MTQREWLAVGLKLLGVYFAVQAAINMAVAVAVNLEPAILLALVYAAATYALLWRAEWCLDLIDRAADNAKVDDRRDQTS